MQMPSKKVLFMGLGGSGKSSIRSVVFDGKKPKEVRNYEATINYTRSSTSFIGDAIQIFDCGGQEAYLNNFVGEKAEFIFSYVNTLIWVVDVGKFDHLSSSKFYFDQAVKNMKKYSPEGEIYCFFHKMDLILPHMKEEVIKNLKQYFTTRLSAEIHSHATSIFDASVFAAIGEIIRKLIASSSKTQTVTEAIKEYITEGQDLTGIVVYSSEGLPVFEEGKMTDKTILPANLWLVISDKIDRSFGKQETFKSMLETDEYIFLFQRMKNEWFLAGIAKKMAERQYVMIKMDQLSDVVNKLITEG